MTAALAGRRILVTGGSRGLGEGMAAALANAGADVWITSRTPEGAEAARETFARRGIAVRAHALDLAQGAAAIEAAAEAIWNSAGRIDCLFNNGGSVVAKPALETSEADWGALVAANLSGLFFACQSFGRRMLTAGGGRIVNTASDMGIRGEAGWAAYSATKGGVVTLSKSLAWEWAPTVSVNIMAPGPFDTPANQPAFEIAEVRRAVEARVPLGRVGDAEADLGPLAVLLAGPGAGFMTGAIFRVDGGICRS